MYIALYKPEIPPNTGNIGRLCYCTQNSLLIIGKPAFSLSDSVVKRAGLDYWKKLKVLQYKDWYDFRTAFKENRILSYSRFAKRIYTENEYKKNDVLLFGSETKGLPQDIVKEITSENPNNFLRIPVSSKCRSLNLSNSVAIVLFEALRQNSFNYT